MDPRHLVTPGPRLSAVVHWRAPVKPAAACASWGGARRRFRNLRARETIFLRSLHKRLGGLYKPHEQTARAGGAAEKPGGYGVRRTPISRSQGPKSLPNVVRT